MRLLGVHVKHFYLQLWFEGSKQICFEILMGQRALLHIVTLEEGPGQSNNFYEQITSKYRYLDTDYL